MNWLQIELKKLESDWAEIELEIGWNYKIVPIVGPTYFM